jgi:hypothetical protein
MTGPTRSFEPGDHAQHDRGLIAAHAAGEADGGNLERAELFLSTCPMCADLHRDLRALALATRALRDAPPPADRRRDFRLSTSDAVRLSPTPAWRRLLGPLLGRAGPGRRLATGLATLGIAGLLLTSVPIGGLGTAGLAPERDASGQSFTTPAAASQVPAFGPVDVNGSPVPTGGGSTKADTGDETSTDGNAADAGTGGLPVREIVTGASVIFLAAGLGLFALRRVAATSG